MKAVLYAEILSTTNLQLALAAEPKIQCQATPDWLMMSAGRTPLSIYLKIKNCIDPFCSESHSSCLSIKKSVSYYFSALNVQETLQPPSNPKQTQKQKQTLPTTPV
ncbi:MAG TPA: hypothetical protein V6C97_19955 [Oculatellaceae cyanobacterium]